MYHEIVKGRSEQVHSVMLSNFEAQLDWLDRSGYQVLSVEDGLLPVSDGRFSNKAVAITFDDGYLSVLTNAFPALDVHRYPAMIFVVSGMLGQAARWQSRGEYGTLLTWAQARDLCQLGVRFGSHSVNHLDLTALAPTQLDHELIDSKSRIEQELGISVLSFAYPYGRVSPNVKARVRASGYVCASAGPTGYVGDAGLDLFELQRITVLATDSIADFAGKVKGSFGKRLIWYRRQLGTWRRTLMKNARIRV